MTATNEIKEISKAHRVLSVLYEYGFLEILGVRRKRGDLQELRKALMNSQAVETDADAREFCLQALTSIFVDETYLLVDSKALTTGSLLVAWIAEDQVDPSPTEPDAWMPQGASTVSQLRVLTRITMPTMLANPLGSRVDASKGPARQSACITNQEASEHNEVDQDLCSLDSLAWYAPFHDFDECVWGIWYDADKVVAFVQKFHELTKKFWTENDALALVWQAVQAHELLHAKVEFVATFAELLKRPSKSFYLASRTLLPKEEALANYCAHVAAGEWLEQNQERLQSPDKDSAIGEILGAFKEHVLNVGDGYKDWPKVRDSDSTDPCDITWKGFLMNPSGCLRTGLFENGETWFDEMGSRVGALPFAFRDVEIPLRFTGSEVNIKSLKNVIPDETLSGEERGCKEVEVR